MQKKIKISFDDEVANRFCYDVDMHRIEISFAGYYHNDQYVKKECQLIIEKWSEAKSKLSIQNCYNDLESHLGIISMILNIKVVDDKMFLTVNTTDNRYVDLLFYNSHIEIKEIT